MWAASTCCALLAVLRGLLLTTFPTAGGGVLGALGFAQGVAKVSLNVSRVE